MNQQSPNRSQLTSLSYTMGGQTLFGLGYYSQYDSSYCPTGTTYDNEEIQCITDSVDSGRTIKYSYDAVGRLLTAKTNGSTNYPQWGLSWTYDQYGNRACQNVTAGTAPSPCVTFNANNQAQGYGYDADGNMTFEPTNNTYGYDDADHMVSYSGSNGSATYTYDGTGRRVQEASGGGSSTVYIFSGGQDIAEYDNGAAPSSPSREYVYAGNRLVAQIAAGTTFYFHQDHLSVRLITGSNGTVTEQNGNFPFGEAWYGSSGATNWVFTTYERDTSESGLDYANARFYDSRLGIFTTIDPLDGWTGDPLSWNAYSYVGNDPINRIDPSGAGWLSWLLRAFDVLLSYFFPPAALGQWAIPAIPHSPITPPTVGGPGFDWEVQLFPHTQYLRTPRIIQPGIYVSAADPTVAYSVHDFSGPDGTGYAQFRLMAINQAPDPDAQHIMYLRSYAMVVSEWPGTSDPAFESVNPYGAIAESGWKDPVNFFHGANSWYFGSLWRNSGHLVDSHWEMKSGHLVEEPISAHIDPYGPLNPLHYLLQIPSMLSSPGPTSAVTCSLRQGC